MKRNIDLHQLEIAQQQKRRAIHRELFRPFFGQQLIDSFVDLSHLRGPSMIQYIHVPLLSSTAGKIILYSPTCVLTNVHLSHKKKDASTVQYRADINRGEKPPLPSFAKHESDCTMYIIPSNNVSIELFHKMPKVIEDLETLVETVNRPDLFSKTFVCWNKKRCEQMIVFDSKNIVNYDVKVPVPRRLFVPPPAEIMKAMCESVFGGENAVYPPLLHWSVYAMKEGKLFGLNFDWHECYMTPSNLPVSSIDATCNTAPTASSSSIPTGGTVVDDDEADDLDDFGEEADDANVFNQNQAQEFHKLTDSKYAVVMMMSNYRRVIKFYFHPSLIPATADPTRKKRICSTIRFELNNGQCLVIPQETKVCVTASQVSNEIFSGKKQKKDFAKTFYFCVLFFGPRM